MKNSTKKLSTLFKTLVAGVVIASTITACSDKNDTPILPQSALSVTQASYDAEDLDLFINTEKVNKKDAFKFENTTGYLQVFSGKINLTIKNAGGDKDTVKTAELDLKEGKVYSLFIANKVEDVEYVVIEDNLTAPKDDKAKVRFIHLSPGVDALDIVEKDSESSLFDNIEFKKASEFKEVDAKSYSFEIKGADSEEVLFSLEDVKIEKGKFYTIWTKGTVGGEGTAEFGAKVITFN
jgi:hypothetical protein